MEHVAKPLPLITPLNEQFWRATSEHRLLIQQCQECQSYVWPISVICQTCWSSSIEWAPVSGQARLSSWVVYHRAFHPAFANDVPYHVAEVELVEGPRMVSTIVGTDTSGFRLGLPLEVVFDDVADEITLIRFRERTTEE